MSAQPVDIQIFGRSLRVNCPPDQRDALNQAADDLNQRLQDLKERTRVTNTEQLVFIAALNISYELAQEKAKTRDYAASMEQRIRMLQQTIEQALLEQGRITEKTNQNFELYRRSRHFYSFTGMPGWLCLVRHQTHLGKA